MRQLELAIRHNKIKSVNKILQTIENKNLCQNTTYLNNAIESNSIDMVKIILNEPSLSFHNFFENYQDNPFFIASKNNRLDIIKVLLESEKIYYSGIYLANLYHSISIFNYLFKTKKHNEDDLDYAIKNLIKLDKEDFIEIILKNKPKNNFYYKHISNLTKEDDKIKYFKLFHKYNKHNTNENILDINTLVLSSIVHNDIKFLILLSNNIDVLNSLKNNDNDFIYSSLKQFVITNKISSF